MLTKFRDRHQRKVLILLSGVIIVAFGLSGAGFYLAGRGKNVIGTIDNRKISPSVYSHNIKLAQIYLLIHTNPEKETITADDIQGMAHDFLVLLWKAKKEKVKVTDQEVVRYIVLTLFGEGNFDQENYERYLAFMSKRYNLALTTRTFEECVREFIKIDKLFERYVNSTVTDDEVKDLYKRDTQKAKIAYLFMPYEKFKAETAITSDEIENFYQDNQELFEREPKVKIKYVVTNKTEDLQEKIEQEFSQAKTIDELAEKLSLEIKETDFIGANDPIEEIGWQLQINKIAFALEKGKMLPLDIGENMLIITKEDERAAFIPPLDEIKEEVKEKVILDKAKGETEQFSKDLLKEIDENKVSELKQLAGKSNVTFKKTDFFAYYDYIEGIGLDDAISKIVFSLEPDQIYEQNLMIDNGAVIIQLKELTPFDEKDFAEKKEAYSAALARNKNIFGRMKFLTEVRKEAELDLTPLYTRQK